LGAEGETEMNGETEDRMKFTTDDQGRRIYVGLTFDETSELDALLADQTSDANLAATEAREGRQEQLLEKARRRAKTAFADGFRWPDPKGPIRRGSRVDSSSFRPKT
jgi:hypothetical protein